MTPYTGKTPIKDALAELCGYSPKSHNKLTQLVNDALHGLGKTSKAKNKGADLNLAIYQWHVDRLYNVKINSQNNDDIVGLYLQSVEIFSQNDFVELYSQEVLGENVRTILEPFSQQRIAFYTTDNGIKKRQVIALDGFYVNALMLVAGIGKKGVTAWVQRAVDNWVAFDSRLPITRQVKYLIVRELTQAIKPHL